MVIASEVLTTEDTEFYQETEALEFVLDLENRKFYWRLNGHPINLVSLSEFPILDQRSIRDTSQFFKFIPPDQINHVDEGYVEIPGYTNGFGLIDSGLTEAGKPIVRVVNPFVITRLGAFTNHGIFLEGENGDLSEAFPIKVGECNAVAGYEDAYILIQGNTRKIAIEEMAMIAIRAAKELQKAEKTGADQSAIESARAYLNLTQLEFDPIPVSFIEDDDLTLSNLTWLQTAVNNTVMPHRYSQRKLAIDYWNALSNKGTSKGEADRLTAIKFGVSVGTIAQWKALLNFPPLILDLIDGNAISSATATKFNTYFNKLVSDGLVPVSVSMGSLVKDAYAYNLQVYNLVANTGKKKPKEVMTLKQLTSYVESQLWYKEALEAKTIPDQSQNELEDDFEGHDDSDNGDEKTEPKKEYSVTEMKGLILEDIQFVAQQLNLNNQPDLVNALVGGGDFTIKDSDVKRLFNALDRLKAILVKEQLVTRVPVEQPTES